MPDLPDETQNLSGTQPVNLPEWKPEPPRTPTPATGHVQQNAPRPRARKRKNSDRSRSALFLPTWSVGVMLLLVFGITASIVLLVITLGGQSAPGGEPRIVIITAYPSDTPSVTQGITPTVANIEPLPSFQGPLPTFGLEGPTLVPVIISPTPIEIAIGVTVVVNSDQLRIRPNPSLDNKELFFATQGDHFMVVDGPRQGSGLTWWQVQDPDDATRKGWAAADYLDVATQ